MLRRSIRRKLPVLIVTFFFILYVDFQLSSSSHPKLSVAPRRPTQQAPAGGPPRDPGLGRGTAGPPRSGGAPRVTELKLEDIYVAVKTTGRFHRTRLALLMATWISRIKAHGGKVRFS